MNQWIRFYYYATCFCSIFGRFEDTKKTFQNYLTFRAQKMHKISLIFWVWENLVFAFEIFWPLNWLCKTKTCTSHSISAQNSQDGIKCTKAKQDLKSFCLMYCELYIIFYLCLVKRLHKLFVAGISKFTHYTKGQKSKGNCS